MFINIRIVHKHLGFHKQFTVNHKQVNQVKQNSVTRVRRRAESRELHGNGDNGNTVARYHGTTAASR